MISVLNINNKIRNYLKTKQIDFLIKVFVPTHFLLTKLFFSMVYII